ncbi:hypothetical protein Thermo_02076 [Thermoplasmatales archaeon]|nr:hypothetical protein Thermo_02076 [Thermoplasmatales archaeon]
MKTKNIDNPIYVKTVFGSESISAAFSKRRDISGNPV